MHKAWLVRPFLEGDNTNYTEKFIQGGYIAVGPNRLPDLHHYNGDGLKKAIVENKLADGAYKVGALAAVINNFVSRMSEMDIALLINDDDIYSMEIMGDYSYTYNAYGAQGFHCHKRKVRFMKHCLRSDLSEDLRLGLKSGRQVADISRHYKEVYRLTYGKDLKDDADVASEPVEISYPLRRNFRVTFSVPGDMTRDEARRLESFFKNLYFSNK